MCVHTVAFFIVSGRSLFSLSVMVDLARRDVQWLLVLQDGEKTIRQNWASVLRLWTRPQNIPW